MNVLLSTVVAVLWMTGTMESSIAKAQEKPPPPPFGEGPPPPKSPEPPPPFGQDPPKPPPRPPRDQDDRRAKIERLENEIRELEGALKRDDVSEERREAVIKRLRERQMALKELLGSGRGDPQGDQGGMERIHHRLHAIEELLEKGVGPEDRKELMAERAKLQEELNRRGPGQHGPPGPPPDPESQKLHMEAQELDRASMELAGKLRMVPKDAKDDFDRAGVQSKLKETVARLFDLREKIRAREVELIKKRLEELIQMLEKRKANRDAIIEKRIKQLTGEADPLEW